MTTIASLSFFSGSLEDYQSTLIETAAGLWKVWIDGDGLVFMEQNSPSFEIIPNERLTSCCSSSFLGWTFSGTYSFDGIERYNYADFDECIGNHGSRFQSNIYFEQKKWNVSVFTVSPSQESDIDNTPQPFAGISPHFTVLTKRPQQEPPIALWACYLHNLGIRPQRYILNKDIIFPVFPKSLSS